MTVAGLLVDAAHEMFVAYPDGFLPLDQYVRNVSHAFMCVLFRFACLTLSMSLV